MTFQMVKKSKWLLFSVYFFISSQPIWANSCLWTFVRIRDRIKAEILSAIDESARSAKNSPAARDLGHDWFSITTTFEAAEYNDLKTVRLLGGGNESLVFLVQKTDGTLMSLKVFREKYYYDRFLMHHAIIAEDSVRILASGGTMVLLEYVYGMTVEHLGKRWEKMGIPEEKYSNIYSRFEALRSKWTDPDKNRFISASNVVYSFERDKLLIIDPI